MKRKNKAIIALLFLSPFSAEVLSGSMRLYEFLNSATLLVGVPMLIALYGFGVLIIREVSLRSENRFLSILLLGMAYGIAEEGIATKTFFNPTYKDLGILGSYGRLFGINIYWALNLTIFHAFMSIFAPILIVESIFNDISEERWVKNRSLWIIGAVFAINIALYNALFPYRMKLWELLLCLMIIMMLTYLALKKPLRGIKTQKAPKIYMCIFWVFVFIIVMFILPQAGVPFLLATAIFILYNTLFIYYLNKTLDENPKSKLDVGLGLLLGWAIFWMLSLELERILVTTITFILAITAKRILRSI